jgi:hypothetical protein
MCNFALSITTWNISIQDKIETFDFKKKFVGEPPSSIDTNGRMAIMTPGTSLYEPAVLPCTNQFPMQYFH